MTGKFNGYTQLSVPASINQPRSVPWTMTALELRDALQENRLGDAAKQKLASDINVAVNTAVTSLGSLVVKRTSAASGFDDVAAIVGDKFDQRLGYIDSLTAAQYGTNARWQFDTIFAYNQGKGFTVSSMELIGTFGHAALNEQDTMSMQYTSDGRMWSAPRYISMGAQGEARKRPQWRPKHFFRNFRGYRFAGFNASPVSFASLQAEGEPLLA